MKEVEDNMYIPTPNDQYDSNHTLIATLSSVSDVNTFFNTYNHSNGYNGLKLGQKINILSGSLRTYPNNYSSYSSWYIAGFDCEYNHTASDGTIRNNGYGICLVMSNAMYTDNTYFHKFESSGNKVPYISSTMHLSTLPNVANSLQSTLGSHLVNRNVLLSSSAGNSGSTAYTWTTAYATLMSIHQLIGYPPSNICNKYDTGEANYFLPLYEYMHYGYGLYDPTSRGYWTRAITNQVWDVVVYWPDPYWQDQSGSNTWEIFNNDPSDFSLLACPMIYIR